MGATGAGKTKLSLELARHEARIALFSCDSMAVYRQMDIGTAKPSSAELGGLTYRLIDLVDPSEEFSIAAFQAHAKAAEDELRDGEVALYVGGSGLYHSAIFNSLVIPPSDPAVRATLEADLERVGFEVMYQRLKEIDPAGAAKIEINNSRRLIRALEVCEITASPYSGFGPGISAYEPSDAVILGLRSEIGVLDGAIANRVLEQFEAGWIQECEKLAAMGELSRSASFAIGYREIFAYLRGEITRERAIEATIARTRRFARRQRSWFGRDPRIRWYDSPAELSDALLGSLEGP